MSNMTIESVKIDGVEYRRVDGEARVGDYIIYDKAPYNFLTAGKPYRVVRVEVFGDPRITTDGGGPYDTFTDTYNVYRKVEQPKTSKTRLTVGDYAKVVERNTGVDDGDIVKIVVDDRDIMSYKVEKVTEPALKVGDYAKVVDDKTKDGQFKEGVMLGEVRKVIGVFEGSWLPYRAEKLDGSDFDWFREDALVRATDDEVEEAKSKLAEIRKWAEIGRKPGEFKVGDIVRVVNAAGSSLEDGDVGELAEIDRDDALYRVNTAKVTSGNWQGGDDIELICPAEKRFDQPRSDAE